MGRAMSETNVGELIRSMSAQRVEAMRAGYEADLQTAWEKGKEAGKAEGISVALNLLRTGTDPAAVAKAAELPEPIIRKLAQDNGIELA